MPNIPSRQATDGAPTYLGGGDPAGRFTDYYPAWIGKLIPKSQMKIHPDSAHGFPFQHQAKFADDVAEFLSTPSLGSSPGLCAGDRDVDGAT